MSSAVLFSCFEHLKHLIFRVLENLYYHIQHVKGLFPSFQMFYIGHSYKLIYRVPYVH